MATNVLLLNSILAEAIDLEKRNASGVTCKYAWINTPANSATWTSIPRLTGGTTLCVYDDTSTFLRCNVCCLWTVPEGASVVQFEMWGAGAGTVAGSCCASSPHGTTGAYTIAIIKAVPGCQYTLCAGCALCCFAQQCLGGCNTAGGCPSFVTGFGLTNVRAEGAPPFMTYCGLRDIPAILDTTCCSYAVPQSGSTPCICADMSICKGPSRLMGQEFPIRPARNICIGTVTCGFVTGLPSLHGGFCLDTNSFGYAINPPTVSPTNGTAIGCLCETFTSSSCCGGCRCTAGVGHRCHPGQGGAYTNMMGGGTAWGGDSGRGGMVKVTFC